MTTADSVIRDARVSKALLDGVPDDLLRGADDEGLVRVDIRLADGRIAGIAACAGAAPKDERAAGDIDAGGGQVWPCFVDVHTHFDKGHIWTRKPNPDGTFGGALEAVAADRAANWSAEDVRRRMDFALRAAYAHGTRAVRTHLDSFPPQDKISWPVFREMRAAWAGRIELQAVSLITLDELRTDFAAELADLVADSGGLLGSIVFMAPDVDDLLDRIFGLAAERGLDLDLHVDESGDRADVTLLRIAEAALRNRFRGRVLCGHCCALAVQPDEVIDTTLARAAEAGLAVVSLPMCNLFLQDRVPGRTPRWRGVTLLHEMAARGIPVSVASDNCRDPFYGYGDHDMLEVFREAARIAHLDRPVADWPRAVTATPAEVMGLEEAGRIAPGRPADLVLFRARGFSELLSRPQGDRVVLRAGRPIDGTLPDYRELDDLMG